MWYHVCPSFSFSFFPLLPQCVCARARFLSDQGASVELAAYLSDGFGNSVRIDYGTGHELSFICFLYCLKRLGLIESRSMSAIAGIVVSKYLQVMRRLQTTYWLEPAGDKGQVAFVHWGIGMGVGVCVE